MGEHTPVIDDSYRRYADLLLRHSRLLAERGEDDPEIEAVEEEMTRLWDGLDAVQRRSLSGLGSDLNWARRGCQPVPRARRPEDVTRQDLRLAVEAKEQSDWHGLLHQLRACGARVRPSHLASLRAAAWLAIGFPQLAGYFNRLDSDPDSSPHEDGKAASLNLGV